MIDREYCGPYCSTSPGGVLHIHNLYPTEKHLLPSFDFPSQLSHNPLLPSMNSFKTLSKQFLLLSLYSSHPHTVFPSAPAIPNTTDTFGCFPIVVVRHASCSIS